MRARHEGDHGNDGAHLQNQMGQMLRTANPSPGLDRSGLSGREA
jgi:hypothetical protein